MFFLIIVLLIMLLLLICCLKVNSVSKKILGIYLIFTLIILSLSTFNLFNIYDVSSKVYFLWIINILFVTLTILIFSKKNLKENKEKQIKIIQNIENSKFIFYVSIGIALLLLYYKVKYNNIIKNLPLEYIRMARFDRLFGSGIESIFFDYILIGSLRVLLVITSILIVNKKYKSRICVLGLISLFLYTMIGYGRMIMFEFAIYIVVSYLIFNCKNKCKVNINIKNVLLFMSFIVILVFIGACITVIRLKGIESLKLNTIFEYGISEQIKQIYVYFTGGFRTLDFFIIYGFPGIHDLTWGRLTFGGIEDMLGLILNNIGYNFKTINSVIGPITQKNVQIGENIYINAFYTCIMNYYSDLGFLGIIVFPLLHGLLIAYSINNYIRKNNFSSFMLLSYVVSNAICSIYRWNYQGGATGFLIISIFVYDKIFSKVINKYNNERNENSENTLDS